MHLSLYIVWSKKQPVSAVAFAPKSCRRTFQSLLVFPDLPYKAQAYIACLEHSLLAIMGITVRVYAGPSRARLRKSQSAFCESTSTGRFFFTCQSVRFTNLQVRCLVSWILQVLRLGWSAFDIGLHCCIINRCIGKQADCNSAQNPIIFTDESIEGDECGGILCNSVGQIIVWADPTCSAFSVKADLLTLGTEFFLVEFVIVMMRWVLTSSSLQLVLTWYI